VSHASLLGAILRAAQMPGSRLGSSVLESAASIDRGFELKAIRVHECGGPESLRYEDTETPAPGPGEALVRNEFAGINYIDVQFRTGGYKPPQLPFTPGSEAAGTVVEIGAGVDDIAIGDRVAYAMVLGAYAEHAIVRADRLVKVPDAVELESAAAVMLQGLTAHYLTYSTFAVQPGDTVLVHAAAGGAGLLITQMAKHLGATVYGTVGSAEKAGIALAAGLDEAIEYRSANFAAEVKRLTDGRGVDVVYDSVGKTTFDDSLDCLRPRGYLVLFGFSSGAVPPFDPAVLGAKGSLFLTRPGLNQYIATRTELVERATALFDWLAAGELSLKIDSVRPLAEAEAAHRALESRSTSGKLLLKP
jgi:NADPH2:quinone reductase